MYSHLVLVILDTYFTSFITCHTLHSIYTGMERRYIATRILDHEPSAAILDLRVEGPIRPLKRLIATKTSDGGIHLINTCQEMQNRMALAIKSSFYNQGEESFFGNIGVTVRLEFYFPRPLHHFVGGTRESTIKDEYKSDEHIKTPDLDNLVRFVLDVLNGVAYPDERYVVETRASKHYGHRNNNGETRIRVEPHVIDLSNE